MRGILLKVFPKSKSRKQKPISKNRDNFSYPCQVAKRSFKRAQRKFAANQFNMDRRQQFIIERRNYRKAVYMLRKGCLKLIK